MSRSGTGGVAGDRAEQDRRVAVAGDDRSRKPILTTLLVPVAVALLAGGSAPWWWNKLFPTPSQPPPATRPAPKPAPADATCAPRLMEVGPVNLSTNAANARIVAGDDEIDSDDWTSVELSYKINKTNDGRGLDLDLTWYAQERNSDRSRGDTRIVSSKTIPILDLGPSCPGLVIQEIRGLIMSSRGEEFYRGEVHRAVAFRDTGSLVAIRVQFDGSGRHDEQRQALNAELHKFSVRLGPR